MRAPKIVLDYYTYRDTRNSQGNLGTDKLFTGQRLDDTGLYYYGARYYDANIGRFISPDSIVQDYANPQAFNRYSYVLNNPLKYTDPSGQAWVEQPDGSLDWISITGYDTPEAIAAWDAHGQESYNPSLPIATPPAEEQPGPSVSTASPVLFPADVPPIQDFFGGLNTLANTEIGLILGAMSGGTFEDGPRGVVVVTNIKPNSPTGRLMSQIEGRTITVGYVILTKDPILKPDVEAHELGHVTQGGILGIFYLPVVWVDSMIHKRWEDRWIEKTVPHLK